MLGYAPPLIVTRDDVDEIVARTERAVKRTVDALVSEGIWGATWNATGRTER
jgi:L-2,4-diaminobutyrate transaminase